MNALKRFIFLKTSFLIKIKEKKFYSQFVNKNDLCFDIGANIGKKSRILLACNGRVIAFEPQSGCLEHLSKINHPKFTFHPFAVGSKNKKGKLYLSNYSEVATLSSKFIEHYTTEKVYWNKEEVVEIKSLDFLIKKYGFPNFCKIDVEGYELKIITNLTHNIPIIEFEFTEKFKKDTIKIIRYLEEKNYTFNYTLNEQLKFQMKNWVFGHEMKDIVNKLPSKNLHGNLFCRKI
ncbi:hypothetical protein BFR04_00625 [Gaetbulibacter sp. 4G1]|nr:FkbM family methyltransferase [Gaetbulibacter sp. 4G1]PIA79390.1 hypothetical protein BFR04_00625 [Gaetbulibacter sp. 4G1]